MSDPPNLSSPPRARGEAKKWWQLGYVMPGKDTLGPHPAASVDASERLGASGHGGVTPRGMVQAAFTPDRYTDFLGRRSARRAKRQRVAGGDEFRPTKMVFGSGTASPPRSGHGGHGHGRSGAGRDATATADATSRPTPSSTAPAAAAPAAAPAVAVPTRPHPPLVSRDSRNVGGASDASGATAVAAAAAAATTVAEQGSSCATATATTAATTTATTTTTTTATATASVAPASKAVLAGAKPGTEQHGRAFVVRSARGFRRENQDRYVAHMSLKDDPPHSFFAVFDGHGGCRAAEYCASHLYKNLLRDASWPEQPIDALKSAVIKTDCDFRGTARASGSEAALLDGSTVISALVLGSHVFITNVGDSRAVLVRASGTVVAMSTDHKPTQLAESVRLYKAGGRVLQDRVEGVLSVSRSVGDEKLSHLVCAKPDIRPFNPKHPDDLIVLASDGKTWCHTL